MGVGKMDEPADVKKTYSKTLFYTDFIFHNYLFSCICLSKHRYLRLSDIDYMYILFENASEVDFLIRA